MFAIQHPSNFNFDKTAEWPAWSQEFDDYRFASGLNERSEEAQVRTLLYTMGRQARDIFQTFGLSEDDEKSYHAVKARFDEHFVAARNTVYESACFHRRSQKPGESVDQFVTALHTLAERCDFEDFEERTIRDRFIVGLRDTRLSETLQMDAELTLASALAKARPKETVHDNAVFPTTEAQADAIEKKHYWTPGRHKGRTSLRSTATPRECHGQRCSFCGLQASHPRSACTGGSIAHVLKCVSPNYFPLLDDIQYLQHMMAFT